MNTVYRLACDICKKNVAIIDQHTKFEDVEVLFVGPHDHNKKKITTYFDNGYFCSGLK